MYTIWLGGTGPNHSLIVSLVGILSWICIDTLCDNILCAGSQILPSKPAETAQLYDISTKMTNIFTDQLYFDDTKINDITLHLAVHVRTCPS